MATYAVVVDGHTAAESTYVLSRHATAVEARQACDAHLQAGRALGPIGAPGLHVEVEGAAERHWLEVTLWTGDGDATSRGVQQYGEIGDAVAELRRLAAADVEIYESITVYLHTDVCRGERCIGEVFGPNLGCSCLAEVPVVAVDLEAESTLITLERLQLERGVDGDAPAIAAKRLELEARIWG